MTRVIKIGTSTLLAPRGTVDRDRLAAIARGVKQLMQEGDSIILVVSGAVSLGRTLPQSRSLSRPSLAALGQSRLIAYYQDALLPYASAQLLLTPHLLSHPEQVDFLRDTLTSLVNAGVVPLINGNDATSPGVGDNDTLAAAVALLMGADQLVILSDVDGLYTDNPETNPTASQIPRLSWVTEHHFGQFGQGRPGPQGSGGIISKLKAAAMAQEGGIETWLMPGHHPEVWSYLQQNRHGLGTRFEARKEVWHAEATTR